MWMEQESKTFEIKSYQSVLTSFALTRHTDKSENYFSQVQESYHTRCLVIPVGIALKKIKGDWKQVQVGVSFRP